MYINETTQCSHTYTYMYTHTHGGGTGISRSEYYSSSPVLGFSHYVIGHTSLCSICLRLVISRHTDWNISWILSLSAAV